MRICGTDAVAVGAIGQVLVAVYSLYAGVIYVDGIKRCRVQGAGCRVQGMPFIIMFSYNYFASRNYWS